MIDSIPKFLWSGPAYHSITSDGVSEFVSCIAIASNL